MCFSITTSLTLDKFCKFYCHGAFAFLWNIMQVQSWHVWCSDSSLSPTYMPVSFPHIILWLSGTFHFSAHLGVHWHHFNALCSSNYFWSLQHLSSNEGKNYKERGKQSEKTRTVKISVLQWHRWQGCVSSLPGEVWSSLRCSPIFVHVLCPFSCFLGQSYPYTGPPLSFSPAVFPCISTGKFEHISKFAPTARRAPRIIFAKQSPVPVLKAMSPVQRTRRSEEAGLPAPGFMERTPVRWQGLCVSNSALQAFNWILYLMFLFFKAYFVLLPFNRWTFVEYSVPDTNG